MGCLYECQLPARRRRLQQLRPVVGDIVHALRYVAGDEGVVGCRHQQRCVRPREPRAGSVAGKQGRHPVVDGPEQFVCCGCEDDETSSALVLEREAGEKKETGT